MQKAHLLFLLLILYSTTFFGQNLKIDSLKGIVETSLDDSTKAEALLELARANRSLDVNVAIEYAMSAGILAGNDKANLQQAEALNLIGILYYGLGNYEQTLDYFYKVLSIHEQTQDSARLAKIYNNIGLILTDLNRIDETIVYYEKSLRIKIASKDSLGVATTYSNLGLVYDKMGELDKAMNYYKQALIIDKSIKNVEGIYKDYSNIGENHMYREQYDSAQKYFEGAMLLMNQISDPYYKAELIQSFAKLNAVNKDYNRAIEKYTLSLQLAEDIDAKNLLSVGYKGLSLVYKDLNDYEESLSYYEKYAAINDELFSEEQAQKLAQVESNFQIQTRENKITLLNKESEIKDLKLSNSEMLIYWMGGLLALITILIILQYRKSVYKTRTNKLLHIQNEEIAEKNKNIMDSILCAKNIQQAILPDDNKLKSVFNEAFVFSKARDVVSGDFYWFAERDEKILIAAVDCTGHGVPAAFLNVLGNTLLNQIVHELNVLSPAKILEELNHHVLESLKSNREYVQIEDGMDIALCMFDRSTKILSFAGAKRPLYFIHNNELNVVKGDHYPVGGMLYDVKRHFNQHELQLKTNDLIYLFTDGIVDQFGGESNKKFMYKRLKTLLSEIISLPLEKQKAQIEQKLDLWRGQNEQTDDMLFIGMKV
jgi:serine phosphatase RsbU (regulator of sigma subunit)